MTTGGILFLLLYTGMAVVVLGLLAWADKRTQKE